MRSGGRNSGIINQIYVIARGKGNQYIQYPEGWDKNLKRPVRKRADTVNEGSGSDVQEQR